MPITINLPDSEMQDIKRLMFDSAVEAFQKVEKRSALPFWMNKGEAANYMNVSRKTLESYIRDGLKVAVKDGTQRISKQSADEYYKNHEI